MNPVFGTMAVAAMGIVGVTGLAVLPPDSQFETPIPSANLDPWADLQPDPFPSPAEAPSRPQVATEGSCPEIVPLALSEGFSEPEAGILARIAWLESRCKTDALGDLDKGVSYGILQIHGPTWCEPSRYWPDGYLQAALVLDSCGELLDPVTAVRAARVIYLQGGFAQWSTYEEAVSE